MAAPDLPGLLPKMPKLRAQDHQCPVPKMPKLRAQDYQYPVPKMPKLIVVSFIVTGLLWFVVQAKPLQEGLWPPDVKFDLKHRVRGVWGGGRDRLIKPELWQRTRVDQTQA